MSPWPGKCLAQAATPAPCSPRTNAATCRADELGVGAERADADHRVLRVRVDVRDRREVEVHAGRASSAPIAAATRSVSSTSSTTPSAALPGYELRSPPRAASRRRPPRRSRRAASARSERSSAVSARSCSRLSTFHAKRTTPPRPSASRRRTQSGATGPSKPGKMQARRAARARAHPLTAPAVSPKAIFRWTSKEEDHHGDRRQRRGRHQPAPVRVAARAVEVREPDGERLIRLVGENDLREDVLVPTRDEDEDRGGHEPGGDEGKQNPTNAPSGSSHRPSPPPRAPSGCR